MKSIVLLLIFLTVCTPFVCAAQEIAPLKPRALSAGDTIMLVAPAGRTKMKAVRLAQQRLEERGFEVIVPESIGRQRGYLAGTDQERAQELMAAFRNPEVDAVFPVTGGYGTTRLLDLLDYQFIAKHPKLLIGFSDITGLHLAFAKKCNLVTLHSPNPEYGLGSEDGLKKFHAGYFWKYLLAKKEADFIPLLYEPPSSELPIKTLRPGKARGRLIGGNMSLVAALMGTPYEIETDERILFLEDVREAPYRIDRMLSQLRLAGKLENPAAVILGAFSKCEGDPEDKGLSLDQVFEDYFSGAPYPVIKNFPAGHGPWNATLPMLALAEVDADTASVQVIEDPLRRN